MVIPIYISKTQHKLIIEQRQVFCTLILLLPPLGLGSKSTSFSPGLCVCKPRKYSTICWKLDLISGFFVFSWLILWADGINKYDWCLVECKGCWLKGLHRIPSVSWVLHHSLHQERLVTLGNSSDTGKD